MKKYLFLFLLTTSSLSAATLYYTTPAQTTNIVNGVVTGAVDKVINTTSISNLSFASGANLYPIIKMTNAYDGIYGPFILYYKARGTPNNLSNVAEGDTISRMQYIGYFSNAWDNLASVYTRVVATNNSLNSLAGTYFITVQDTNNDVHLYTFDNKGYFNTDYLAVTNGAIFHSNVGVGTLTPFVSLESTGQIASTMYGNSSPSFIGRRARGTISAPTVVQSNDYILTLSGRGYDGAAFSTGSRGYISIKASENWAATSNGTHIVFGVTSAGSTTASEVIKITNSGIYFPDNSLQTNAYSGGITTNIVLYTHADDGTTPVTNNIYITNGLIKNWTY